MLTEFQNLTPAESQAMFDAIPLITILVAGADDNIDEVEMEEAQRLGRIRSFNNEGRIIAYYEKVEPTLPQRIHDLSKELPDEVEARQAVIAERLAALNPILAKMKQPFGYLYYRDFRSFAKHIAEAHGGFLRFMTVGPKEAKVVDLPMLTEVEKPSKVDFPELY